MKRFLIGIVLLMLTIGVSCTSKNISSLDSSIVQKPADRNEILSRINNVDSYEVLVTKKIDIDAFVKMYDNEPDKFLKGNPPRIPQIDESIGIECIRNDGKGMLYSVHKVKQGGLLYILYDTIESNGFTYVRNWYYVKKSLSFNDFSNILIGSTISDVKKIDPITSVYIKKFDNPSEYRGYMRTFHYLKDGILSYDFEYKDGKFVVSSIDFDKDFYAIVYGASQMKLIDGRVLPMDLIK